MNIEIVLSGLIIRGEIRNKGEVLEVEDGSLPSDLREQAERWDGKIFYVEVDSEYDTSATKKILENQGNDLLNRLKLDVSPQLTPQGTKVLGVDGEEPSALEQLEAVGVAERQRDEMAGDEYFDKGTLPETEDDITRADMGEEGDDGEEDEEGESEDEPPEPEDEPEELESETALPTRTHIRKMKKVELRTLEEEHDLVIAESSKKSVSAYRKAVIAQLYS